MVWVQLKGLVEVNKGIIWMTLFQQHNSKLQKAQLEYFKTHSSSIATIKW